MLSALLERVLLQAVLGCNEALGNFLELLTLKANLVLQIVVLLLELLVLIALLRVEIVEAGLVCKVDIIDLLLIRIDLILHVALLGKEGVQMSSLLVILVLDMHVERLDILGFGIAAMLVKGQVVISEVTLELAHILDQSFILAFKLQVSGVVPVDFINFGLHFVDLGGNLVVLVPHQVVVVVAIVDLTTGADALSVHT